MPKGTFADKTTLEPEIRPFEIDPQTLKDLDLFDGYHDGGIFTFFNKVQTIGGKNKLEAIFRAPSQNIQEIKSRRDSIRFLEEKEIYLGIDKKQIAAIEYFLQSDIRLFKNRFGSSFISYIKNYFNPSGNYYTVETGIKNIIHFLIYLDTVVSKLQGTGTTYYLSDLSFKIQAILTKREICETLDSKELIFPIGKLDHFFRNNKDLRALLDIIYEFKIIRYCRLSVSSGVSCSCGSNENYSI